MSRIIYAECRKNIVITKIWLLMLYLIKDIRIRSRGHKSDSKILCSKSTSSTHLKPNNTGVQKLNHNTLFTSEHERLREEDTEVIYKIDNQAPINNQVSRTPCISMYLQNQAYR
jgi:hypothetical protein